MNINTQQAIINFINDSISNPYSLLLSIIILFFVISLLLASVSRRVKKTLISWKILEKEESPTKLLLLIISILIIIKMLQSFVVQPFLVDGGSMLPTLNSGQLLLIDKLGFDIDNLHRGDVIVFRHIYDDQFNGKFFIKRLIGLPGDRVIVNNGVTTIYNKNNPEGMILDENFVKYPDYYKNIDITLSNDEYLAFGDNRKESYDSRSWGVIKKENISGKAIFCIFPFNRFGQDPGAVDIKFTSQY